MLRDHSQHLGHSKDLRRCESGTINEEIYEKHIVSSKWPNIYSYKSQYYKYNLVIFTKISVSKASLTHKENIRYLRYNMSNTAWKDSCPKLSPLSPRLSPENPCKLLVVAEWGGSRMESLLFYRKESQRWPGKREELEKNAGGWGRKHRHSRNTRTECIQLKGKLPGYLPRSWNTTFRSYFWP